MEDQKQKVLEDCARKIICKLLSHLSFLKKRHGILESESVSEGMGENEIDQGQNILSSMSWLSVISDSLNVSNVQGFLGSSLGEKWPHWLTWSQVYLRVYSPTQKGILRHSPGPEEGGPAISVAGPWWLGGNRPETLPSPSGRTELTGRQFLDRVVPSVWEHPTCFSWDTLLPSKAMTLSMRTKML